MNFIGGGSLDIRQHPDILVFEYVYSPTVANDNTGGPVIAFGKKYPNIDKVPSARLRIADCYYVKKDYEKAAATYQVVFKESPSRSPPT